MRTDADGRFEINQLDLTLLFRVLVVAPGRRAIVTEYIDPANEDLRLVLLRTPEGLPADRILRGRIVDEKGRAIFGAVITPVGAKTSDRRWWGSMPGVDAAAVSDEEGRFIVTSQDPKLALDLQVSAPGYAIYPGKLFPLDGQQHEIQLWRGATVRGSLSFHGKPAAERTIGIVQRDRSTEAFVGDLKIDTDKKGRFVFSNVQTNQSYVLYTLCPGTGSEPALKTRTIKTGEELSEMDVGDLQLVDGFTVAGRVELPRGAELPSNAKLVIGRQLAWDSCEALIASDSTFVLHGLPPEVLTITVSAAGFETDSSQLRFQSVRSGFAVRLRHDLNDLVIPLIRAGEK